MGLNERAFAESLAELVKLGVDAQREQAAQIADSFKPAFCGDDKDTARWELADAIAKAIRADVGGS